VGGTRVTMNDIQTEAKVSENTARRARDSLIGQGWVAKHPTKGRESTEYSWVA
jgi:DNA-binding IclR family transcriptional regulator